MFHVDIYYQQLGNREVFYSTQGVETNKSIRAILWILTHRLDMMCNLKKDGKRLNHDNWDPKKGQLIF